MKHQLPVRNCAPPGGPAILVVDDEPALRNMLVRILDSLGHPSLACADGEAAVDLFREHGRDIAAVVLDVVMPGMDGFATLSALRIADPTIPVMLVSGFVPMAPPDLPPGVAFLAKPFTLGEFHPLLTRLIDGRAAPRADRPDPPPPGPEAAGVVV